MIITSVNNETGGIWNPKVIDELDSVVKDYMQLTWSHNRSITLFLDHTQGFMKDNSNLELADAFCFSAHKIGGMNCALLLHIRFGQDLVV